MPFFYDSTYIYLIPAIILAIYAQAKVKSTFSRYNRIGNNRGLTAAEVAQSILNGAGIYGVRVERVAGELTDHYDPRSKVLRLSDSVYNSTSVAAIGVAAHECGHAIQDEEAYAFLRFRNSIVPVVNISSNLAMPLVFIGLLFGGSPLLIDIGIIMFSAVVLFHLVTLPVEFNASNKAIAILDERGILVDKEVKQARKVLNAAALTYVASTFTAIMQLIRLLALTGGRRRDD